MACRSLRGYLNLMRSDAMGGERVRFWRRVDFYGLWAVAFFLGVSSCGPGEAERRASDPRPNILLISLDTTRADHLSAYGYERETSAALDAFADDGVLFETAYAPSATTGPSHASLFTSLSPASHGVTKNGKNLGMSWTTVAEVLASSGYETAAVVSSYVLASRFGYDQGFEHFDEDFSQAEVPVGVTLWEGEEVHGKFYGRADDTTRRAVDWLEERPRKEDPFFLFVHYFDPHDPYTLPDGYVPPFRPGPSEALKKNRVIYMYDAALAYMDQELGRLLNALGPLGLDENTLVVITGDHGEGLMEHGHWHHGIHIYEEGVRVPLVLRWPSHIDQGRRIQSPVSLVDLAPSLLALSGVPSESSFLGESLAEVLTGQAELDPDRPVWLYRRHYAEGDDAVELDASGEQWGLREGRWKLISGIREGVLELYDLKSDPGETVNLADRHPEVAARMQLTLDRWLAVQPRGGPPAAPIDEEVRQRLEALGYVE